MEIHSKSRQDLLVEGLQDKAAARDRFRALQQQLLDRMREINDAPERPYTGFWCAVCIADFNGFGTKVVHKRKGSMPVAWYVSLCPARHKCIRRITEKHGDSYYMQSKLLIRERVLHRDDMLTPDDPRFYLLYGHKHGLHHLSLISEKEHQDGKPKHTRGFTDS